jgi:isoleucyl-tRNA synthetase
VLNPLWNAAYFFTLYANTDRVTANHDHAQDTLAGRVPPNYNDSLSQIDEYILAKLRILIEETDVALTNYDIPKACEEIKNFLDVLTNWYIRRSRERFWESGISEKKQVAYETLFLTLIGLCRVIAPILPLLSEHLYRTLTGRKSVHLEAWPLATSLPNNKNLITAMDLTREVCSAGLSIRESKGLRTRLPLEKVILAGKSADQLAVFTSLIAEELNVKSVVLEESFSAFAEEQLQLNSRVLGPRLGNEMKNLIASSKTGNWYRTNDGQVICNGIKLDPCEYTIRLVPKGSDKSDVNQICVASISQDNNSLIIALSVSVTPELEKEGVARDLVRHIQQARKDANLIISDKIDLMVFVEDTRDSEIIKQFSDYISAQTLAASISIKEVREHNLNSMTEDSLKNKKGEIIVNLSNQSERKISFIFSKVNK